MESSYVDFGEASDNEPPEWKISATTLAVGITGIAPITDEFDVFGKIGYHFWDVELNESGFGLLAEEDGSDIMYALGANYKVTSNFSVGVSYSNYKIKIEGESSNVTMLSLNGKYYF
ncbi:MAG: outer membrane beta-barrel protein [Flavobacterium sp.]